MIENRVRKSEKGNFEPKSSILPESGSLPFLPRVEYVSTAERENLPFAIDVNAKKLGIFLSEIGFTVDQINKFRLIVSYKTPPSFQFANIMFAASFLGKVAPDGSIIIDAKEMINITRGNPFKQFLKGVERGDGLDLSENLLDLSQRIRRFFCKQMIPENTEVPEEEQLRKPSLYWSRKLGIAANKTGRYTDAVEFLDDYTLRSLKRNFQLVIPHELIHLQQEKPSKTYLKAVGITIPLTLLGSFGSSVLAFGIYKLATQSSFPLVSGSGEFLAILIYGLGVATTIIKVPWVAKKFIGGEKEAYHDMHKFGETFANIISVRSTAVPSE